MSKLAVAVPAKGQSVYLDKCIESLLNLGHPDLEIIIVDDGLDIIPKNILEKYRGKIKVLNSESRGPSFARNLAAKNTQAEFIAFTDSDCLVDKNWLGELLKGLKTYPEAVACGGIQELPKDATSFEKKVFLFMRKIGFITDYMRKTRPDSITEVAHNASCCVVYKRDIFLKQGGFLESLWPGEDVELDYRLRKKGYKLVFNPKALVYHYRPKKLKLFFKMMFRYGEAQGILVKKYGVFRKIQILPFLAVSALAILFISNLFNFLAILAIFIAAVSFIYFKFDFFVVILSSLAFINWNMGFCKGLIRRS